MKLGTRELYQPIQSCHVVCLGTSNKSVALPRQDSIRPCRAHAVLSGHCNIYYVYTVLLEMYVMVELFMQYCYIIHVLHYIVRTPLIQMQD